MVLVAYWSAMWLTVSVRDLPIPDHAVAAGYKQAILGVGFAAGAGVFGYPLTMLLRSTVATLGVLFAVGFFCVVLLAGVLGLGGEVERVMPWGNFAAYIVGSYQYYDYDSCGFSEGGGCGEQTITRSAGVDLLRGRSGSRWRSRRCSASAPATCLSHHGATKVPAHDRVRRDRLGSSCPRDHAEDHLGPSLGRPGHQRRHHEPGIVTPRARRCCS